MRIKGTKIQDWKHFQFSPRWRSQLGSFDLSDTKGIKGKEFDNMLHQNDKLPFSLPLAALIFHALVAVEKLHNLFYHKLKLFFLLLFIARQHFRKFKYLVTQAYYLLPQPRTEKWNKTHPSKWILFICSTCISFCQRWHQQIPVLSSSSALFWWLQFVGLADPEILRTTCMAGFTTKHYKPAPYIYRFLKRYFNVFFLFSCINIITVTARQT